MFGGAALLVACLGLPGIARGGETPAGRFVPFTPLSASELYTKRMRFEGGEPIVSIGVMEGQRAVRLSADGPVRLMFEENGLPKTIYGPSSSKFLLRPLEARPAGLRFWVVVERHSYLAAEPARARAEAWKAKGHAARVFEVGTVVALSGNVLDTRARLVAIGGFLTKAPAEQLVSQLFQDRELRASLHEELLRPPEGAVGIHDRDGRLLHRASGSVYFGTIEGGRVHVHDVEHSRGYKNHGHEDRSFAGHVYVVIDRFRRLTVVNSVGAEQLLGGLVPVEIFPSAPLEALKAQAVTARGEVFSKLGHRHFGEPFHLCSEQHCQVYAGVGRERGTTARAIRDTHGMVAARPRARPDEPLDLVDSVYSSTCGGFTEANEVAWDQVPSPSLRPRLDGDPTDPALRAFADGLVPKNVRLWMEAYPPTYCGRASFVRPEKYRWKRKLLKKQLDAIAARLETGPLKRVEILGRGPGGRVTGVRLHGQTQTKEILRELPVRRLFSMLNSGSFVMEAKKDPETGTLLSLTFVGAGWGHGVGMCQMGAIGRAERGHTFRQILRHYYSGAVVERIY